MDVRVRLAADSDVPALVALLKANRTFLAPWEPERSEDHFTETTQHQFLSRGLERHAAGTQLPLVILAEGHLVGRIDVNDIVRGAFQSAHLGYWVDQARNGRGVATAAVAAAVQLAFGDLQLHRLQADTLLHNTASQRVLARNGFTRIGTAAHYLRIAGRWQDCHLHQLLSEPVPQAPR